MAKSKKTTLKDAMLRTPVLMILFSIIGLLASVILAAEKVNLLENPQAELSCSINPVYSCQSVILSDQASVLGFPNEFLGIAFFGGMLALSLAVLSGAILGTWLKQMTWLGLFGGMLFVFWFFYQSVYNINALCIYCSITWFAIWSLFVVFTRELLIDKVVSLPSQLKLVEQAFVKKPVIVWLGLILLFAVLIVNHFWYYYGTLI